MVFSSLTFICIFLPAVLLLHLLSPSIRIKNAVLLAASILFYAYGEPVYVILLLVSALVNWACALLTGGAHGRKWALVLALSADLALLGVFKYAGFITASLNTILHISLPVPQIALPVGISFYTFQAMSYVIDVYRGECSVQRNYLKLLLYISFFPQLIAGPIVRYRDIEHALTDRRVTAEGMAQGISRFCCGLAKKVLIANYCGVITDTIYAADISDVFAPTAWIAAFAYMMQIYFDFSGYSDMAIGLGHMFGFTFRENFRWPYAACSVREFWRRWHISLSDWLREYLYIPLGGNRRGRARTAINKMIVFLACGIWHGANVTFLFWGFYHGMLQLLEELLPVFRSGSRSVPHRILSHIYTFLAVMIGFVFFRADTLGGGMQMIGRMFAGAGPSGAEAVYLLRSVLTPQGIFAMAAGMVFCLPVRQKICTCRYYREAAMTLSLAAAVLCILNLAGGTYNPFIYFRF